MLILNRPHANSRTFLFIVALLFLSPCATAKNILLAQIYSQGVNIKQYLVREKLDGMRAIWDGKPKFASFLRERIEK